jgi:selenide,water dikinase
MKVGVHACTDVTGFGLMGHLKGMVKGSEVCARVHMGQVPLLPGAWDLLEQGVAPGGTHRNHHSVADVVQWHADLSENQQLMLCDAQTSGGLLISVAADKQQELLAELVAQGVDNPVVVGEILEGPAGQILAVP